MTAGRSSRWRRPEFQAELARIEKLPEASVVNIPKSGHWIHVDAPEALLVVLAYFNSVARPVTWVHSDRAPDLVAGRSLAILKDKHIRVTTTARERSRQNLMEPGWRAGGRGMRAAI